jgi:mono/diheme cytochrome c family protein
MRSVLVTAAAFAIVTTAAPAFAQSAQVQKGEKVYTDQKCSMCHSIGGHGNAKGPLDNVGSKLSADEIRQWITDSATMATKTNSTRKPAMSTMAAKYKALPKDDVDALVAYLQSLKGK